MILECILHGFSPEGVMVLINSAGLMALHMRVVARQYHIMYMHQYKGSVEGADSCFSSSSSDLRQLKSLFLGLILRNCWLSFPHSHSTTS